MPHEHYLVGFLFSFYGFASLLSWSLSLGLGFCALSYAPFDVAIAATDELVLKDHTSLGLLGDASMTHSGSDL